MKPKRKITKKARLLDLKDDLLESTSRLCKIFDALGEKDSLLLLKKINSFVLKPKRTKEKEEEKKPTAPQKTPTPSAKPSDSMDFNQDEFDNYTPRKYRSPLDSSHSEPFSTPEDTESDSEKDTDDLNIAINLGEDETSEMEMEIVKSIRIRDRFGDKDDFLTDKSIVTKHNLNVPKRIDPFKDAGKILGRYPHQTNQYSTASAEFKKLDPIQELPEHLTTDLNSDDYDAKIKWRLSELTKLGLKKDKLELKNPNEDVFKERERLENEYKRYIIDLDRRALKVPEPNMIDTTNGECSAVWRNWFQNRMEQMECWLVEDAVNYHLPPSLECDPPAGLKLLAVDWNIYKKSEIEVPWNFATQGPLVLRDDMVYDGNILYNPLNGKTWSNIVEHLEDQVKKRWRNKFPESRRNPFDDNGGLFWCQILQQWYDLLNVSIIFIFIFIFSVRNVPQIFSNYPLSRLQK